MLCQNCGKGEANVRYTQIINGVKKEMILCEKCSKELGVSDFNFNMPINLSSFFGEFLENQENLATNFLITKPFICEVCGMDDEEFASTGKFGCENCYEVFSGKIDPILKNIQAGNRQVGRTAKNQIKQETQTKVQPTQKQEKYPVEELKKQMKQAIKEEQYEEAAKLRDAIRKIEKE